MRQIVLDTETTGKAVSEKHRVIEIGCIELNKRRITGQHFHCYLNPQRQSEAAALAVHGLTDEFLSDKPLFSDIINEFLAFIKGAQLIIHNAVFDLAFLNYELRLIGESHGEINDYCTVLDTLSLARQRHPGQRNSLDALCKRYAVDSSQRNLHGALLDAELLARVYLRMTGGQPSLFSEVKPDQNRSLVPSLAQQPSTNQALRVIYADVSELAAHQHCLAAIVAKAGRCLWPTDQVHAAL